MTNPYMHAAIESAREGIQQEEGGPFGASIAKDGQLVSVAHNTVLKDQDPTCHAEMNAIRQACQTLGTHILDGCTLYTTAEPCPMCLSAILWARINKVVVGVDRDCAKKFGFDDSHFYDQVALPPDQRELETEQGVMSTECEEVFEQWQQRAGQLY